MKDGIQVDLKTGVYTVFSNGEVIAEIPGSEWRRFTSNDPVAVIKSYRSLQAEMTGHANILRTL